MAVNAIFDPVSDADIDTLVAEMRQADRDEITASSGPDIRHTLRMSIAISEFCYAVRHPDGLFGIMGLAPYSLLSNEAAPWFLGTGLMDRHPRTLARWVRRYIREMARVYPVLVNHVDARNTASIKLLEWLGFTLFEPEPFGVAGLPFHRFELRAKPGV